MIYLNITRLIKAIRRRTPNPTSSWYPHVSSFKASFMNTAKVKALEAKTAQNMGTLEHDVVCNMDIECKTNKIFMRCHV